MQIHSIEKERQAEKEVESPLETKKIELSFS